MKAFKSWRWQLRKRIMLFDGVRFMLIYYFFSSNFAKTRKEKLFSQILEDVLYVVHKYIIWGLQGTCGIKMKQLPFMGIICTVMLFIVYRTTKYQYQHTEVQLHISNLSYHISGLAGRCHICWSIIFGQQSLYC